MDFRRVVPPFRAYAFTLQVALLLSLLLFLAVQVNSILASTENPPTKTTLESWEGAGLWAVCDSSYAPGMYGAGITIPRTTSYNYMYSRDVDFRSWNLTLEEVDFENNTINCSLVDLRKEPIPAFPFHFSICFAQKDWGYLLLWTNNQWQLMSTVAFGWLREMSFHKKIHGWDYLYSRKLEDIHMMVSRYDNLHERNHPKAGLCPEHYITWFGSERRPWGGVSIAIPEPLVEVTLRQGILPQLAKLLGEAGGYMALLTTIFTLLFVRKNPHSDIANIYEERTFIGESICGSLSHPGGFPKETE